MASLRTHSKRGAMRCSEKTKNWNWQRAKKKMSNKFFGCMAELFTPESKSSGAIISPDGMYRYHLWRVWDSTLPVMCFVMLNPSTANDTEDDPTVRRCIGFARRDGFGGISVRNVFALRATDPRELDAHHDPVGPENGSHLLAGDVSIMTRLVVAWGNRRSSKRLRSAYKNAATICAMRSACCFGTNKGGDPKHPLYLPIDSPIVPWTMPSY